MVSTKTYNKFKQKENTKATKEEVKVHLVGRINREIYKCITDDILTDEVIITDERIRHIKERRGKEFYNIYADKFIEILQSPDYIFSDKSNTALACKEFVEDGKFVNVVLRIAVSSDNPEYKNSIITAIGENRKRFQQRMRNNNPLYKKG
ncbi:MAG: PBECR2 nuclease fold domain-containing protein [Lachnospiraceae bacterium]|nr:PBECR2 nuclease fold domain-containing protein [Lachnospiraceae bacterium]